MVLEIDNVELYFKGKAILKGIYLKAESGKITGVLGSNGCGKTCLFSIIFGHLKPKYKLIRIDGKPHLSPLYLHRQAAFLPQHFFIPRKMKVKTAFRLFQLDYYDFAKTFEDFAKLKNSKFGDLSGGERRLIEIYLILHSKAKLILLDEPFTHLSPLLVEKVKELILEEKKEKAIVVTDHFYEDIMAISDDLYLLKNGSTQLIKDKQDLQDYRYISHL